MGILMDPLGCQPQLTRLSQQTRAELCGRGDVAEEQAGFSDYALVDCPGVFRVEITEQHEQRLDSSPLLVGSGQQAVHDPVAFKPFQVV
ncbi:hypothetical protein SJ05684_b53840 (plasmid) [Sinorhizobium sojae CCBAU 05684]|uniref:Uncharacterized protein n=1 Tax=Sinorhizobium sojae CCBAU 05684 TaxID=716928 RepID=A0A249PKP7_9HYPH|nr:hypothetical protein SJ05684_b53840 [Sinorhizobium sojae CCBAU 05684]